MQQFQFHSASSVEDALVFLQENGSRCKIIAGGTDLIPALRLEDIHPEFVLNVLEIEELRGIKEEDGSLWIGPTTTFAEIAESDLIRRNFPMLVQAAASVGGPQIRNRGTIGGNISNASPAADVLPAVLALEGELELRSRPSGLRRISLSEAISAPYKTHFRSDELLTGVLIKKLQPGRKMAFEKLGRRNAMARARMNLSIVLGTDKQENVTELRIVPGAVMPVARRAKRAEMKLLGQKPAGSLIESSVETLAEEMIEVTGRRWSTNYKVPVLKNIARRLLKQLIME
jgi:carbon-monoxide dehydrogenase medium subunit/xanthine dehydrogenase FAD-binding subunit